MVTGQVKFFNSEKGFGFIQNGNGPDIFVHESALKNCRFLKIGVHVRFEVHASPKGLEARNVELIRQQPQNSQNSYVGVHQIDHRRFG